MLAPFFSNPRARDCAPARIHTYWMPSAGLGVRLPRELTVQVPGPGLAANVPVNVNVFGELVSVPFTVPVQV